MSLDVQEVAEYNAKLDYYNQTGVGDRPDWPYIAPLDSSFANCVKRKWTFENCAGIAGGDMYYCAELVKDLCCP